MKILRRKKAEKAPLRAFLHLNRSAVDEFLAQLEGGLLEGHVASKQRRTRGLRFLFGWKEASAGGEAQGSTETEESRAVTYAAKFQRLYQAMEKSGVILRTDEFSTGQWLDLSSDTWIQVSGRMRLPSPILLLEKLGAVDEYAELTAAFGDQVSPIEGETWDLISKLRGVAEKMEDEPLPILIDVISGKPFSLMCRLERGDLRVTQRELVGEAIVLGKIIATLAPGAKEEVCSVAPRLTRMMSEMNREERRRSNVKEPPREAVEYIRGPAAILLPVAVWR